MITNNISSFTVYNNQLICCGITLYKFEKIHGIQLHLADDDIIKYIQYNPKYLTFITMSINSIKIWNAINGQLIKVYNNLVDKSAIISSIYLDQISYNKIFIALLNGTIKILNILGTIITEVRLK